MKRLRQLLIVWLIILLLGPWANAQTAIETAAAGMSAGQLLEFHELDGAEGWNTDVNQSDSHIAPGSAFEFSHRALAYDYTPRRTHTEYLANGGESMSATSIDVDTGTKPIRIGDTVHFDGVSGTYTVTANLSGGTFSITPGLAEALPNNTLVRVSKDGRRVFLFGHGHNGASFTWPTFSVYEFAYNEWTALPAIHDLMRDNTDADRIDVYGELHHTYGGFTINVGRQELYRLAGNTVNPVVISKVLIDEYDVTKIGGTDLGGQDEFEQLKNHWKFEPGFTSGFSVARQVIEFFPEQDKLKFFNAYSSPGVWEKRTTRGDTAAWSQSLSQGVEWTWATANSGDGMIAMYNPVSHIVLYGASQGTFGDDPPVFWYEAVDGSVVELDDGPIAIAVSSSPGGLVWVNPINGHYQFLIPDYADTDNPKLFYDLNPLASTGNQWTELDESVWPEHMDGASTATTGTLAYNGAIALPDIGVVMVAGAENVWLFKPSANTRAADGLTATEKKTLPGFTGSVNFGDDFIPKYAWSQEQEAFDADLAAAVSGETWYSMTDQRVDAEGNILIHAYSAGNTRSNMGDGIAKPEVVTDVTYKGEPGSLRFRWPNQVGESRGYLRENIDGTHGTSNGSNQKFVGPGENAIAPQLWMQFAMRFDSTSLAPHRRALRTSFLTFCSTPSPDSTTVNLVSAIAQMDWVDRLVYFNWQAGQDWDAGFRTITAVNSSTQVVVDSSPTLSGEMGVNGQCQFEGDGDDFTAGTKLQIIHGNAPVGCTPGAGCGASASTSIEITGLNVMPDNYVTLYGLQGQQGFGNQAFVGPLVADTWHQVTTAIDTRPASHDWYSTGVDSAVIKSDSFDVPADSDMTVAGTRVIFSGYGTRGFGIEDSTCVAGVYEIESHSDAGNSYTLDRSPSLAGTAAADCEVYVQTGIFGWMVQYRKNRVRLWIDGELAIDDSGAGIGYELIDDYGIGSLTLSTAANDADPTFIHDDAYQWFSHLLFSRQPFPFATATLDEEEEPAVARGSGRLRRLR